jgi:hypothetical protein
MSDSNDILVQLARIEGKQDVTNERLNNVQEQIASLRRTQDAHSGRIANLEADKNVRAGERQGIALGGRILWSIIGAVPVGIGALLLRVLGA